MNLIIVMNRALRKMRNLKVKILYMRRTIEKYVTWWAGIVSSLWGNIVSECHNIVIREVLLISGLRVVVRLSDVFGAVLMPCRLGQSPGFCDGFLQERTSPAARSTLSHSTGFKGDWLRRGFRLQSAKWLRGFFTRPSKKSGTANTSCRFMSNCDVPGSNLCI